VNNFERNQPKHIVLCSDGTGNRGGKGNGTNVWRLYQFVDIHGHHFDASKPEQVTCYDDGVGTEDFKLLKLLGGAFGWGLSRNIRELYEYVVTHYRPGDHLYLFGFSRGAFTVRSLAGMILTVGIVRQEQAGSNQLKTTAEIGRDVKRAFRAYRANYRRRHGTIDRLLRFLIEVLRKSRRWSWVNQLAAAAARALAARREGRRHAATDIGEEFRRSYSHGDERIRFIGAWDTVDAVGVPFDGLRWLLDVFMAISFHDQQVHARVDHACHALAIDDERHTFHPVMWDERGTVERSRTLGVSAPRIEQVWFAGAHSNVGGGYPKQGMAMVTLHWMMQKAATAGLRFREGAIDDVMGSANVHDKLYDSRSGLGAYYRYLPRDIGAVCDDFCADGTASIHRSVLERIEGRVQDYAPGNFPSRFKVDQTESIRGWSDQVLDGVIERVATALQSEDRERSGSPALARWRIRLRVTLHWLVVSLGLAVMGTFLRLDRNMMYPSDPIWLGELLGKVWRLATGILPDGVGQWLSPGGAYVSTHPWWTVTALVVWGLLTLINALAGRSIKLSYEAFWSRLLPLRR